MRITVLGGCGAWPAAGSACSGFLVERDGFRILLDAGYAVVPRLLAHVAAKDVDAVLITHGHPDHCADLSPLLRARAMQDAEPAPPLPVYAPPHALDAVLALDRPGMLDDAYELREFEPGAGFEVGPFSVGSRLLPHWVPNAGFRLTAGDEVLVYTGDGGPCPEVVELAEGADLLIAEATYPDVVPPEHVGYLSSARQAAEQARDARAACLMLTHLWPGTEQSDAIDAAAHAFHASTVVATAGLVISLAKARPPGQNPRPR
jgi:ribonuclease BN (tRNA processing enzyme)